MARIESEKGFKLARESYLEKFKYTFEMPYKELTNQCRRQNSRFSSKAKSPKRCRIYVILSNRILTKVKKKMVSSNQVLRNIRRRLNGKRVFGPRTLVHYLRIRIAHSTSMIECRLTMSRIMKM